MSAEAGSNPACTHFVPNPFKKDFCKNCQKGKALHGPTGLPSQNEPCGTFEPNPFKPDFCKNCQQGKTLHAGHEPRSAGKPQPPKSTLESTGTAKAEPQQRPRAQTVAVQPTEPKGAVPVAVTEKASLETAAEGVCGEFIANPFKADLCKTCRHAKAAHHKAEGPKAVVDTVPEGACSEFSPNPFKPTLCKTCRLPKADHREGAKHVDPATVTAATQQAPKAQATTAAAAAPQPTATAATSTKPLAAAVAPAPVTSSTAAKPAAEPSTKPPAAAAAPAPATSSTAVKPAAEPSTKPPPAAAAPAPVATKVEVKVAKPGEGAPQMECTDYAPHAFKKDTCRNCSYPRSAHAQQQQPPPKAATSQAADAPGAGTKPASHPAPAGPVQPQVAQQTPNSHAKADGTSKPLVRDAPVETSALPPVPQPAPARTPPAQALEPAFDSLSVVSQLQHWGQPKFAAQLDAAFKKVELSGAYKTKKGDDTVTVEHIPTKKIYLLCLPAPGSSQPVKVAEVGDDPDEEAMEAEFRAKEKEKLERIAAARAAAEAAKAKARAQEDRSSSESEQEAAPPAKAPVKSPPVKATPPKAKHPPPRTPSSSDEDEEEEPARKRASAPQRQLPPSTGHGDAEAPARSGEHTVSDVKPIGARERGAVEEGADQVKPKPVGKVALVGMTPAAGASEKAKQTPAPTHAPEVQSAASTAQTTSTATERTAADAGGRPRAAEDGSDEEARPKKVTVPPVVRPKAPPAKPESSSSSEDEQPKAKAAAPVAPAKVSPAIKPKKVVVMKGDSSDEDTFAAVKAKKGPGGKPAPPPSAEAEPQEGKAAKTGFKAGSDHHEKFRVKTSVSNFVDDDDDVRAPAVTKASRIPKSVYED